MQQGQEALVPRSPQNGVDIRPVETPLAVGHARRTTRARRKPIGASTTSRKTSQERFDAAIGCKVGPVAVNDKLCQTGHVRIGRLDVVNHYDTVSKLRLTEGEKNDLTE